MRTVAILGIFLTTGSSILINRVVAADATLISDERGTTATASVSTRGRVLAQDSDSPAVKEDIGVWGAVGLAYATATADLPEVEHAGVTASAYQRSGAVAGSIPDYPNVVSLSGEGRVIMSAGAGAPDLSIQASSHSNYLATVEIGVGSLMEYNIVLKSITDPGAPSPPAGLLKVTLIGPDKQIVFEKQLDSFGSLSEIDGFNVPPGQYTLSITAELLYDGPSPATTVQSENYFRVRVRFDPQGVVPDWNTLTSRLPRDVSAAKFGSPVLELVSQNRFVDAVGWVNCPEGMIEAQETIPGPTEVSSGGWAASASNRVVGDVPIIFSSLAWQRSIISDRGFLFAEGFAGGDYTKFPPASGFCNGYVQPTSRYEARVVIDKPRVFDLDAYLDVAVDYGPGILGGWSQVTLIRHGTGRGESDEILIDEQIGIFGGLTNTLQVLESGTLQPGQYTLVLEAFRYSTASLNNGSVTHGESYYSAIMAIDRLPGDVSDNGIVDVDDLLDVVNSWGPCAECAADVNRNGVVDVDDLLVVINNWS